MTINEHLSTEEISRRITRGMGLVYDLFKELDCFFKLLVQGLENSEADLYPLGTKVFSLPRSKKGSTAADRYIRTDMGLLVAVGASYSESQDMPEEEDVDTDEEELEVDIKNVSVTPETRYVGIRAILYDPSDPEASEFHPVVVAALMGLIKKRLRNKKGSKSAGSAFESNFQIRRRSLRSLIKQLHGQLSSDVKITARVKGAELSAKILAIDKTPLAEIDTEDKVNAFVERLVEMV